MKKGLLSLFLFNFFFLGPALALSVPEKPEHAVNDYAGLLSGPARAEIEDTLLQFEKETSNQVVVAIFPGLEGGSLEDFSIRLAEKWKIGSKKNNNGVILLIFREDHQVRIEVGYGLEGALPDLVASQIIRREITPAFRAGDFDGGVRNAVSAIIRATKGEYRAGGEPDDGLGPYAPYLFFLVAFLVLAYLSSLGRRGRWGGGGGSFTSGGFSGGGFGGGGFGGGFGGGGGGSFGGGGAGGRW
ncbi:MAG: TPM domain-containing protein [Candidatus Omnitrophica bacterium]|nr:TPM domain-containing protein [Candidatus Omnitrophota bacterium]